MSYGATGYGGAAYGGTANSANEQIFFPVPTVDLAPDVLHERSVIFNGQESLYSVFIRQGSENPSGPNGAEYKVYASHSEGETPQLQVTLGGAGQTVIGAARLIIVTALVDSAIWPAGLNFSIVGRPYTPLV
jgi:hypothetical protein